jgi:hypothetical protein
MRLPFAVWSLNTVTKPARLSGANLRACGVACLTTPRLSPENEIRCNLVAGHEGDHARVFDPTAWRQWPQDQTEPLPLQ